MSTHRIDPDRSKLLVRTRATGLLARFAHDLEMEARAISGTADASGPAWTAELSFPVARLAVLGVRRGGRVETGVLSTADQADIERKIRDEVLQTDAVRVSASGEGRNRATVSVRVGRGEQKLDVPLTARDEAGELAVVGSCRLSLRALAVKEIKGPLGAFKVDDAVEIVFDLRLTP